MMSSHRRGHRLVMASGWILITGLLLPLIQTFWVSFSPDSFLTPPTTEWSLKWYTAFIQDARWWQACLRSLIIAGGASLIAVTLGGGAVYCLRTADDSQSDLRRRNLDRALIAPAILPVTILGFGLLPIVFWSGLWGSWLVLMGINGLLNTPIASLIIGRRLTGQLTEFEQAAQGLGAGPGAVLWRVSWPLLRPAVVCAAICVFAISLNESVIAIFLSTPSSETLPAVIWPQLRFAPSPLVAVASCVTAAICSCGIAIVLWLSRNRH